MQMNPTEQAIELEVERRFNRLDQEYLGTHMTAFEYNKRCEEIHQWAREQYGIGKGK